MKRVVFLFTVVLVFSAVSLSAQNAKTRLENGKQQFEQKKYDAAIQELTEAIKLDPKLAEAYAYRARAYNNKNNFDQGIDDANKAIQLDPKLAIGYFVRGNAYLNKNDYDRAIADYTVAIKLDPKDANVYCNRGFAYDEKEDYDRAIADYNEALRINPNFSIVKDNLQIAQQKLAETKRKLAQEEANRFDPSKFSFEITAKELIEAYQKNELQADNKYKDKIIKVTGKVIKVKKNDSYNKYYIEIEGPSFYTINAYVQDSQLKSIENLTGGQTVIIVGQCAGYNFDRVFIINSIIQK